MQADLPPGRGTQHSISTENANQTPVHGRKEGVLTHRVLTKKISPVHPLPFSSLLPVKRRMWLWVGCCARGG